MKNLLYNIFKCWREKSGVYFIAQYHISKLKPHAHKKKEHVCQGCVSE